MRYRVGMLFALLLALSAAFIAPASSQTPTPTPTGPVRELGWDVECDYTYTRSFDPIVMPDGVSSLHKHDIFGGVINRYSTYATLRAADNGACSFADDESAYWAPTAYTADGVQVLPRNLKAYYRVAPNVDPMTVQWFPSGIEVVSGSAAATGPQTMDGFRRSVRWFCGGIGNGEVGKGDLPVNCTDPDYPLVGMQVVFGDCSDGRLVSEDFHNHLAYSTKDGVCPESHPVHVPRLGLSIFYQTGSGAGLYLDNNMEQPPTAYGMHADFMDGWSPEEGSFLVEACMQRGNGCGVRRPTS